MFHQIELHDVVSFLLEIDEFYVIIPDTKLYSPGLSNARNHVDVYWHILILQPIAQANTKLSEQIDQTITAICYNGTQEIVIKYHSALDPKMKDKLVHFPLLQMLWAQGHE